MTFRVPARRVDQSALRVNQAFIGGLLLLGFLVNSLTLVMVVGLIMLAGTASPDLALFQLLYRDGLRPARLIRPRIIIDNPEPHHFSQGFGGILVILGVVALLTDHTGLGWALVLAVAGMAVLYLATGFCAGCFIYYRLNRLGVPGFRYSPIHVRQ